MQLSDAAIRLHRAQIFRYLRRRTESDELADDLTQDVFASAAAHLGHLQSDRPLLAWLYRVAHNRLVDEIRARDRRPRLVELTGEATTETEAEFGPLVAAAIRRASLRLDEGDREILGLRLFAGETFAEIANHLNVSEPAAKMRYMRALRRLRHELEKEGVEHD
jgi:RNA polymerase sigma-70 factor, ECF subfamily